MLYFLLLSCLFMGWLGITIWEHSFKKGALGLTAVAFFLSVLGGITHTDDSVFWGIGINSVSWLMSGAVSLLSFIIQGFGWRHFAGHREELLFWKLLPVLTLVLLVFVSADHLLLTVVCLGLSNGFLVRLMHLHASWRQARASAQWAALHLGAAVVAMYFGVSLLQQELNTLSWEALGGEVTLGRHTFWASILFGIAAFLQSAIFPFHRWLIASANAPTPVSAFMHAGLINGGALILFKTSGVWMNVPLLPTVVILLGALTALVGTLWMLVQADVKRTLTCSTMGQMGFMIMQCGLGLFPAAIAHMIWHGFFKASLFLSAGSVVHAPKNKSLKLHGPGAATTLVFGLAIGGLGGYLFWILTGSPEYAGTTFVLLPIFCGITCAHAVMTIWQPRKTLSRGLAATVIGLLGVTIYGIAVRFVEVQIPSFSPVALAGWHFVLSGFFALGWGLMLFRGYFQASAFSNWLTRVYVWSLETSRPDNQTITTLRAQYQS